LSESRAELPRGKVPCVIRHLAYAAGELARSAGREGMHTSRFHDAEAALRSLADGEWSRHGARPEEILDRVPVVSAVPGSVVSLVELLAFAWERDGRRFPDRTIHPEMVEAARQLLQELAWTLPN